MSDTAPTLRELGYWSEIDYATFRRVKISTLRNERCRGLGPPFVRIGRQVCYPIKATSDFHAGQVITRKRPTAAGSRRARAGEAA